MRRSFRTFVTGALALAAIAVPSSATAATITVDVSGDAGGGQCTLRQAMEAANTNAAVGGCVAGVAGMDTIVFSTGSPNYLLRPATPLPVMTEPVTITGPASRAAIEGDAPGAAGPGLDIRGAGSVLANISIGKFSGVGISIAANSVSVHNSHIGVSAFGHVNVGNAGGGIASNGSNIAIGGDTAGLGNVISGNGGPGVRITGGTARLLGNRIGTDYTGTLAFPNTTGVLVSGGDSSSIGSSTNTSGVACTGGCNVISGNSGPAIRAEAPATSVRIVGNRIGVGINGVSHVRNGSPAVVVDDVPGMIVGGRNGSMDLTQCSAACNVISGAGTQLELTDSPNAQVTANFFGMNAFAASLGDEGAGVVVADSNGAIIGADDVDTENRFFTGIAGTSPVVVSQSTNVYVARNRGGHSQAGVPFLDLQSPVGVGNDANPATGSNRGIQAPTITTADASSISGSAVPGAFVRVFVTNSLAGVPASRLEYFLGMAEADGSGRWTLSVAAPTRDVARVTANVVTTDGSSEFASAFDGPAPAPIVVDTTAPDTSVVATPPARSNAKQVTVTFSASEPGTTFRCQLDANTPVTCTSPATFAVGHGPHVLRISAVDAVGNADPTPALVNFVIDQVAPVVTKLRFGTIARKAKGYLFTTTEAGTAVITLQRAVAGRRVGKKCAAPTKGNATRKPCTRYVPAGTIRRVLKTDGTVKIPRASVIVPRSKRARALTPGRYRATIVVTDALGNASRENVSVVRVS